MAVPRPATISFVLPVIELYPAIVRATALSLLGQYPGEESTRAFAVALADPEPLMRHTAVNSFVASRLQRSSSSWSHRSSSTRRGRCGCRPRCSSPMCRNQLLKSYQREALAEALTEYRLAMEHSLDFSFAGHNLGNLAAASRRRGGEAERYYRAAVSIDDLFFPAKANLAVLLNARRGENDEAEALAARSILEAYPEQHDVAYSLGLLLAEMGQLR